MKRLIFIFIAVLLSSFLSFAQTGDGSVPAAWLKGINPTTGKQAKDFTHEMLALVEPLALKVNLNGISTLIFDKMSASSPNKCARTWNLSSEAQDLINYAIGHRQWLCLIYKDKKNEGFLENLSSILSLSLIPYTFETADSVGGAVPETERPEWTKESITFSGEIKGDTVTEFFVIPMLALENGNAYLVRGGINDMLATKGSRDYLHIDNVPTSALPFLRFLIKKHAGAFVTYDKATLKVYKMRLHPGWDETIIIGNETAVAKPH